jgi:uncharacterized protein (TIGR02145 family)
VRGILYDLGKYGVTQHGFCWSLTPNRQEAVDCRQMGPKSEKGDFVAEIGELEPETTYYVWAYASSGSEITVYGDSVKFTTLAPGLPVVMTGEIFAVTQTSAEIVCNVPDDNGAPVTERGICWGTEPDPTISQNVVPGGSGTGEWVGTMTELQPYREYHVRAFAVNRVGTAYSENRIFQTLAFPPQLDLHPLQEITSHSVLATAGFDDFGGAPILEKGFCWSAENPEPTKSDFFHVVGSGPGIYELVIGDLQHDTEYHVRAFATNVAGTSYTEPRSFRTLFQCGTILVDPRDGQEYLTVSIGEQCWMARNLNVGEQIPGSQFPQPNDIIEKHCYDDDPANCEIYGGLYRYEEMMQYQLEEKAQGVCPDGWHIPSDNEWKIMEMALGMTQEQADSTGLRGLGGEGGRLKTPETPPWEEPNEGANNVTGFSALPSGNIQADGTYYGLGIFTDFWTSTTTIHMENTVAWYRLLAHYADEIERTLGDLRWGTPVRCIKD